MRVALVCCPEWSITSPPYAISLLKSILLEAGHDAKTFDFNIEAYQFLKNEEIEFFAGQNFFYWEDGEFDKEVLPRIDKLMDEWVEQILNYSPDFIGFTVYHTSIRCTQYLIKRVRKKNSKIKIVMGGPQCFSAGEYPPYLGISDYICTGEGEKAILEMLKYPDDRALSSKVININENPVCNYDDYNLESYERPTGASIEASRGCVAKCAFCLETHYWIYRSKKGQTIVDEMKQLKEKYGFTQFRFNDSLVNGNIKQFYNMVDALSKDPFVEMWDGYARIDGKMDLEFMKKIKKSGNDHLSYGLESGSQKVLDDMRKGITVQEIEQNLKDSYEAELRFHVNWMVGFPTENQTDHATSLVFLFNNAEYINGISPGMTCGIGDKSALKLNPEKFNIAEKYYWNNWVTNDFKNTGVHRHIRLKCTHIWVDMLNIFNGQHHENLKNHFTLNLYNDKPIVDRIEPEECPDFSYLYDGSFKSSLHGEFLSFFWVMYKAYGQFDMILTFEKDRDIAEFGTMIAKEYDAHAKFVVNSNGKWKLFLNHEVYHHKPFFESIKLEGQF